MRFESSIFYTFMLLVTLCHVAAGNGTRKGKPPPPLVGDGNPKKNNRRSTECQFGKRSYELEQTWHPDLGPPFGVMYCIRCECMAVQKKKRVTGRTVCKNVKNECPKITCTEPILRPGHCCKTCPEDGKGYTLLKEDTFAGHEEDDKNAKDYAGVLVGPLSMIPTNASSVGTVRLSSHRRNLHFSLVTTPDFKVKTVQFMNDEGTVLEEQEISDNEYTEATGKVCGTWRRIPRIYRGLLREEKLWFAIVSHSGEALSTRPTRFRSLASEALSALLTPQDPSANGAGATAIVSLASSSNSVHVSLVVSGLLRRETKEADSTLAVSLVAAESEDGERRVIEQLLTVQKPQDQTTIEIRTVLEPHELKQLTRGQVVLTVYSKRYPNAKLSGVIGTRITCDIYDTVIQPSSDYESNSNGVAWFYLGRDGSLSYRVSLENVTEPITSLAIEIPQSKTKKRRTVHELNLVDNWANGTTGKLTPRDLESLYSGELSLRADTSKVEGFLQGKLVSHPVSESYLDLSSGPTLLTSSVVEKVALAWISIDPSDCSFHYDLQLVSSKKKTDPPAVTVLELIETSHPVTSLSRSMSSHIPTNIMLSSGTEVDNGILLLSPNVRVLEEFSSPQVDNTITDLSALTLARMEAGGTFLKLTESGGPNSPGYELQGQIKSVKVPTKCLPQFASASLIDEETGDSPLGPGYVHDEENEIPKAARCMYEGRIYEDGAQWNAEHKKCEMCSCQKGRIVCDPVICPVLTCQKTVQNNDDCCPVCQNVSVSKAPSSERKCYFEGNKKYYSAGTKWHPYIPPFGFDQCAICSCDAVSLKVECTRLTCPEPPCPESERYRPDPKSCCQECRAPEPIIPNSATVDNDGELKDEEDPVKPKKKVLSSGGCSVKGEIYENGDEWHPRVLPWGEMKCINCNCKDSKVKCKRQKCPKNRCIPGARVVQDECCPPCEQEKLKDAKRKKTKPKRTLPSVKHEH